MSKSTKPTKVRNFFADLTPAGLNDAEKDAVVKLALAILKQRFRRGRAISSPADTRFYLRVRLADCKNEVFGAMLLDNRHRIIEFAELFHGTIDGASVYPRVVVQRALEANAAAVVFYHTHPSGVAEPSAADQRITRRLVDALTLIDVRVLDHFVVTAGETLSFAESGLL